MHILTFDIEDWFHTHQNRKHYSGHIWNDLPSRVIVNTNSILQMLDELELKASFFILGWVAEKHPQLVRKIHNKGHEIGSHSYWHHNANLLRPEDFEKDLKRSMDVISTISGEAVTAYRAPGFSLKRKDLWAFEILAANGIEIDSSVQLNNSSNSKPYTISTNNHSIFEYPLVTSSFFIPYTGGGYYRAMPEQISKQLFKKETYRLLYFHPRDFDMDNPYSNLFSLTRNLLNRYRTDDCLNRLKSILNQYPSVTLHEAVPLFSKNTSVL